MLFHVRTEFCLPKGLDPEVRADLVERDRAYVAAWRRVVAAGESTEFALIDAATPDELHAVLSERPLARFATPTVTAVRRD